MLENEVEELRETVQRDMMRTFLRNLTTKKELLLFCDEFEKECQRRGLMMKRMDFYETNPVGRSLANLLSILCALDFDMKMWDKIVEKTMQN